MRAARSGSSASSRTAAARAGASPGGTSSPVSPSRTTSATPPWAAATTGSAGGARPPSPRGPAARAGWMAPPPRPPPPTRRPRPGESPAIAPARPRPAGPASSSSRRASSSAPGAASPAISATAPRSTSGISDSAWRSTSWPFQSLTLPTSATAGRSSGMSKRARASSAVPRARGAREPVLDHARSVRARELARHGAGDARQGVGAQQARAHERPQRRGHPAAGAGVDLAHVHEMGDIRPARHRARPTSPPRCCRARAPPRGGVPARPARGDHAPRRVRARAAPAGENSARLQHGERVHAHLAAGPLDPSRPARPARAARTALASARGRGRRHDRLELEVGPIQPGRRVRIRTVRVRRPSSTRALRSSTDLRMTWSLSIFASGPGIHTPGSIRERVGGHRGAVADGPRARTRPRSRARRPPRSPT